MMPSDSDPNFGRWRECQPSWEGENLRSSASIRAIGVMFSKQLSESRGLFVSKCDYRIDPRRS